MPTMKFSSTKMDDRDADADADAESGSGGTKPAEIEVERKFSLDPASGGTNLAVIEVRLASLRFRRSGVDVRFTDWYFDLPGPDWALSVRDCWLRYRDVTPTDKSNAPRGVWQLKRGRRSLGRSEDSTTVYEEIEGEAAISAALAMIPADKDGREFAMIQADRGFGGYFGGEVVPSLPAGCGLVPFARFETTRSGWTIPDIADGDAGDLSSQFHGLSVDIDSTDFGYAVGEVEAVVGREEEVSNAQNRIGSLTKQIIGEGSYDHNGQSTPGKLETYLMQRNPYLYKACLDAGVM